VDHGLSHGDDGRTLVETVLVEAMTGGYAVTILGGAKIYSKALFWRRMTTFC